MYAWVRRTAALVAAVAAVAASQVFTPAAVSAAPGDGLNDNVNPSNEEYSHAAEFVAAGGGGSGGSSGDNSCPEELPRPADLDPAEPWKTHYEWNSYESSDGTWSVFLNCVLDGENVPNNNEGTPFPPAERWSVVWYRLGVVPRDPQEMAAEVLARLRPGAADIHTDPGNGQPSFVAIETWLWLDQGVFGEQDVWESEGPVVGAGPLLQVHIQARPAQGGQVIWDTGDGTEPEVCADGGGPPPDGTCTHEYNRSSAGQAADASGNPAYRVTASYAYEGTYETYVMGELIDSGPLGLIPRSSETTLAVAEAQSLNTGG